MTPRALFGWSPPATAADTAAKRLVDRWLPRTGAAVIAYFISVVALLALAPLFPKPGELLLDALAALAGAGWCALNFWRCGHAHCIVSASGWAILAALSLVEAMVGRSLIGGNEQLVFLLVLLAGLIFEGVWYRACGTNAVGRRGRLC